jgi:hypothetical protein
VWSRGENRTYGSRFQHPTFVSDAIFNLSGMSSNLQAALPSPFNTAHKQSLSIAEEELGE